LNKDEDLEKDMIRETCMLEREKEREGGGKERLGPNLEQPQGFFSFKEGWREIWVRLV
jgi:hypothetical protein